MNKLNIWYKLDNAAKLFPAVSNKRNSSTFRLSLFLKEAVDPEILQSSLKRTIERFPMFAVRMRRGLFWYFIENNDEELLVQEEINPPCSPIDKYFDNGFLLRVLYFNNKISVEFFHSISDGSGAAEFLKTLTCEYLKQKGYNINLDNKCLSADDICSPEESEDSFKVYSDPSKQSNTKEPDAYKMKGTGFTDFGNNIIKLTIDTNELKDAAKRNDATLTEYITSLFILSIYKDKIRSGSDKRPINITIPINLRNFFPSKTLRNFFSVMAISVDNSVEPELKDIIPVVRKQFKEKLDKELILEGISSNYKAEKLFIIKIVPLFLKDLILKAAFNNGTKLQTGTISNLGRITMPEEMKEFIDHMEFILYSSAHNTINAGVCSIDNKLVMSFSRTIRESVIIKNFTDHLVKTDGVSVSVHSNNWGVKKDEMY